MTDAIIDWPIPNKIIGGATENSGKNLDFNKIRFSYLHCCNLSSSVALIV